MCDIDTLTLIQYMKIIKSLTIKYKIFSMRNFQVQRDENILLYFKKILPYTWVAFVLTKKHCL